MIEEDFEKEYSTEVLQKNVTNEKYKTKMKLKLKNDGKYYCLLTYLPNFEKYVAYSTFEIKSGYSKTLYLWYIASTNDNVKNKGIGYENLKFLIEFAKENNCLNFEFRYCPKNENAVNLYKKFPFTKYYDDYEQYMTLLVDDVKFKDNQQEIEK